LMTNVFIFISLFSYFFSCYTQLLRLKEIDVFHKGVIYLSLSLLFQWLQKLTLQKCLRLTHRSAVFIWIISFMRLDTSSSCISKISVSYAFFISNYIISCYYHFLLGEYTPLIK
jgi:hypothetical protein